jgi:hypothetical protein
MVPAPKSVYVFGIHIGTQLLDDEQSLVSKCLEKYDNVYFKCYGSRYDQSTEEDLVFVVLYETVSTIDYRPQKIEAPTNHELLDELYDKLDELDIPLEGKGMYHFVYYDDE